MGEIDRDVAKRMIEGLFRSTKKPLYYSDIIERFGFDLWLVVSICRELMDEGKIEEELINEEGV